MIIKKLLSFQQLDIKLVKKEENPFFKSKYVDLNQVLEKVKKPLNDLKIVIIQEPTLEGLKTRLVDTEDDTEVSCVFPYVGHTNAQQLGSANTYARRYSLVTILGLEDEDDDGNKASTPTPKKTVSKVETRMEKVDPELGF